MATRARLPPLPAELAPPDTEAEYGPIAEVYAPGVPRLTPDDMLVYVAAAIDAGGVIGQNLDSYNELVTTGIRKIVTDMFRVDLTVRNLRTSQPEIDHFQIEVDFSDAEVKKPVTSTFPSGQIVNLTPAAARNTGQSYSGPLYMAAEVKLTAHYADGHTEAKTATVEQFEVSQFPIMVGSKRCHTYHLTREARRQLQEDPHERGGYFIARNGEWAVELLENIRFNSLHVYLRIQKERVRGEFISQPGGAFENSSQIIIRLLPGGAITVEVNSIKFQRLQIPFYLFYRLFGMTCDADILESVVGDYRSDSPVAKRMAEIVDTALHVETPRFEELRDELDRQVITERLAVLLESFVTNPQNYRSDEEAVRYLTGRLVTLMDQVFLPHVGTGPAARIPKLRFLGMLIHKMLLVEQGSAPPTDRDSFVMKRVHGAGVSFAKAFKAMFNSAVVAVMVSSLKTELKLNDFAKLTRRRIEEASRAMFTASSELNRLMEQALTSGNKLIMVRRRALLNRLASNPVERKNGLNLDSALRRITAQNAAMATKGTERAELIRAVHSDSMGYIDPYHSPDTGEKVGMEKQLACTTDVCAAGSAATLAARLAEDPDVLQLDQLTNAEISARHLARVFVNGDWVGCCERADLLVARYRSLRRRGQGVAPMTTVAWKLETNEVEFWLDVGRVTRPLVIVDNNQAAYDAAARRAFEARRRGEKDWEKHRIEFVQGVRLTAAHVEAMLAGRLTLEELVRAGVVEYVAPEEMENCLLAESITQLYARRNDVLTPYTHCDVPQALCGFASLVSPYGGHTQPVRVCYETNQGRSACGWYCLAFPFRADQLRFLQFYVQNPLVRTLAADVVLPNGLNTLVAYMTLGGDGQEDSAIVSQDFVQRGGFGGVLYQKRTAELGRDEQFGTPDPASTRSMRAGAMYGKLVDGFVQPGARVGQGDVLVGRVAKAAPTGARNARETASATAAWVDRSVVYNDDQEATVDKVWSTVGADDATQAVVSLRIAEPLNVGDKMCLSEDHEVWTLPRGGRPGPDGENASGPVWTPVYNVTADDLVYVPAAEPQECEGYGALFTPAAAHAAGRWARPTRVYRYAADSDGRPLLRMVAAPPGGAAQLLCTVTDDHRMVTTEGTVRARDCRPGARFYAYSPGDAAAPPVLELIRVETSPAAPVYCLEVPGHEFLVRSTDAGNVQADAAFREYRPGPPHWTGNSSRAGNKSITARVLSACDLPYDRDGNRPDIIINPHSIPSRMVVGQIIEAVTSLVCAQTGALADGTMFREVDTEKILARLRAMGLRESGQRTMFSPETGEYYDVAIFMAPTFQQRLQKFVDLNRYVAPQNGPCDALTGQPLDGKKARGGLRIGEMENWVLAAKGMTHVIDQKTRHDADGRVSYICRRCGLPADYNERWSIYNCPQCGAYADIAAVPSKKSSQVFFHELQAAGIDARFSIAPRKFDEPA